MLVAGILLVLILSTLVAYGLKQRGAGLSQIWMILAGVSIAVWLAVLFISHNRTIAYEISNWFKSDDYQVGLNFSISPSNWAMIFALLVVHIAFLFISGSKQEFSKDFIYWIIETIEIALSFAVLSSADLLTILLSWTALDISGLIYQLFIQKISDSKKVILPNTFKLLGSLLLLYSTAQLTGRNQSLMLQDIPLTSSATLFAAAILHSGILPFQLIKREKRETESYINFIVFFLPFITSLFLISYLPGLSISVVRNLLLKILFLLQMMFFGFQWITTKEELNGIYYLLYAFTGYVGYRFLTETQSDLVSWFVVMLIYGIWLLLFSHRGKSTRFFPIFLLISLSGLPFTLVSYGSGLIMSSGESFPILVSVGFHLLFMVGTIGLMLKEKELFDDLESASQINYLTPVFITILSIVIITFRSMGSLMDELSYWWLGILITILSIGFYLWQKNKSRENKVDSGLILRIGSVQKFLSFDWLFFTVSIAANAVRSLVTSFSQLMEGEGGILWSIVFMTLLITLLKTGG